MASLSRNAIAVGAVAIAAALIMAFSGWFERGAAPQQRPSGGGEPGPGAVAPARGDALPAAATAPDKSTVPLLRLPDGTSVPYLNDVTTPVEFTWEQGRPYSPIVGQEKDKDGVSWYVHADGCRTTTRYIWRDDLGRNDATSVCKTTDGQVR